ncbi:hypothetical protein FLONG3_9963, partial [Fusarium longipes]
MSYQQGHQHHSQAAPSPHNDRGLFEGGSYSVTHRDTNAVLNIELQQGTTIRSRSDAMIHMSDGIEISGKSKFSFGKLFTGGAMYESEYDGPGHIALGPTLFGDIIPLPISGSQWTVGKDAFLACTSEVTKKREVQGLSKALFSGEDLFVFRVEGHGVMWLTSFGAVDRLNLRLGEEHIVDNGHLVAWNCEYSIEKAGGGTMTGLKTGEGLRLLLVELAAAAAVLEETALAVVVVTAAAEELATTAAEELVTAADEELATTAAEELVTTAAEELVTAFAVVLEAAAWLVVTVTNVVCWLDELLLVGSAAALDELDELLLVDSAAALDELDELLLVGSAAALDELDELLLVDSAAALDELDELLLVGSAALLD